MRLFALLSWMSRRIAGGAALLLAVCSASTLRAQAPAVDQLLAQGSDAMRQGNFAVAAEAFRQVTQQRPGFAEGFLNLGLALEQDGKLEEAVQALQQAGTLKPQLRGVHLFEGIALYRQNDYRAAEAQLRREVTAHPQDASALMWLGVDLLAEGKPEQAVGPLDKAASLDPKNQDILYHRGRAHLLISKQSYQQMYALDPQSWHVYQVLGQANLEALRTDEAIHDYVEAVDRAPRQPGLHESLGDAYWTAGRYPEAQDAYTQELAIDPHSTSTLFKLGSLYVVRGTPEPGVPLLKQALASDPSLDSAHFYLGRGEAALGQDQQALAEFLLATQGQSDPSIQQFAWYQLMRLYRRLGRTEDAAHALNMFRKLHDAKGTGSIPVSLDASRQHTALPKTEEVPADADDNH